MNSKIRLALGAFTLLLATSAAAQVTLYGREGFRGRAFTTNNALRNFDRIGLNDRVSSIVVERGRWELCSDANFEGRCVVLRRGSYDSLSRMGMNDAVSSIRPLGGGRVRAGLAEPEPLAAPTYEFRARPNERLYEARVTSVRAVMGPANQRCWVERERVGGGYDRSDANIGGAIAGAIIGGVLGHQVGSGRGNDAATAAGAVAGAAIGSQQGRGSSGGYDRDVRRCETVASGPPAYWDVTYIHRGTEHRAQMSAPPGPTVTVNQRGEPRG